VGERPADPLTIEAFVTAQAEFVLRSDAGRLVLRCHREGGQVAFEASEAPCTYILRLHQCEPPSRVQADGTSLSRLEPGALDQAAAGWALDDRVVIVKARARKIQLE
jgi:hypothetical protein